MVTDHRQIDQDGVVERYLNRSLPESQRLEFEAHLVDCQECLDRLLLAQMFKARNGGRNGIQYVDASFESQACELTASETRKDPHVPPLHVRLAARLSPWQLVTVLAVAALLLLLIPTVAFLSQLPVPGPAPR